MKRITRMNFAEEVARFHYEKDNEIDTRNLFAKLLNRELLNAGYDESGKKIK